MRIYYNNQGRRRGYSRSGREALFWNYSVVGLFIKFAIFVIALPIFYFPRAVWRTRLPAAAKLLIIGGVWGALVIFGVVSNAATDATARAMGCISIASAPNDYFDPSGGNNNCAIGYELGPRALTCATSLTPPFRYTSPIRRDPSGNPICPDGYQAAPKPGPGYKAPFNPPLPSRAVQRAACRGHQGAETGPDFPPPTLDGHQYIVSCMDGTEQTVPAR